MYSCACVAMYTWASAVANLGPCTCCKASLVSEDYSEDCLQEEGHCHVDTKNQSVVLMLHMSGDLNSAVVQIGYSDTIMTLQLGSGILQNVWHKIL